MLNFGELSPFGDYFIFCKTYIVKYKTVPKWGFTVKWLLKMN